MEPYVSHGGYYAFYAHLSYSFKTVNGMEPYVSINILSINKCNISSLLFQNRKRYGALRKFVNYSLQYRVVIDMFQNRKRYGALRKFIGEQLAKKSY